MNQMKKELYQRQTVLPEIGVLGQKKLEESNIAIVGCGGLGGSVAVHLAASGVGTIHLIDYDRVAISNLHRQVFYKFSDVGEMKAKKLADYIQQINPFVKVSWSSRAVTRDRVHEDLDPFSIVVDCTDSLKTKYLLNDYCVLQDKTLVYGSLYKHDGYVATFNADEGSLRSSNLRDAFPEIPKASIPTCSEIGTLNPIVGIIAMLQANEVIKLITGTGSLLKNRILVYNSMENSQFVMRTKASTSKSQIREIHLKEDYQDPRCETQESSLLISAGELKKRLSEVTVLSVLEGSGIEMPFEVQQQLPYSDFHVDQVHLPQDKDLVVVCRRGISSYRVVKRIKSRHPSKRVLSLVGGIEGYSQVL